MTRRLAHLAAIAAVAAVVGLPPTALADCDGPFPSFSETAPSAAVVVIGQVVYTEPQEGGGVWSSRFDLAVERILRGDPDRMLAIRDLTSQPCAGFVVARPGSTIALALEGRAFEPPVAVNAFAIIGGPDPQFTGLEVLTLEEVLAIVPEPPQAPIATNDADLLPAAAAFGLIVLVVGGLVVWRAGRET